MPKYEFECGECRVRFERNLKVGEYATYACPSCKDPAPRVVSDFGFSFSEGKSPANSGVHDHDYPTADKAVGRSATQRWAHLEERKKVKEEARRQGGSPALIRHTGKDFIDYEPMSDVGRDARRKLVRAAQKASTEARDKSSR